MPYNYILLKAILEKIKLNLRGAIIVVDEAYNISQATKGHIVWDIDGTTDQNWVKKLSYLLRKIDAVMLEQELERM